MHRMSRTATAGTALVAALAVSACAPHSAPAVAPHPSAGELPVASSTAPAPLCPECAASSVSADLAEAIEARVADLKSRGGACEEYGAVLESALTTGRIVLRPYMWRVDGNLASAEGESSGQMTIARDIDSLNVGVRRLDDVLRSAEHEAAHIALHIASGDPVREARVDERVNSCRAPARQ